MNRLTSRGSMSGLVVLALAGLLYAQNETPARNGNGAAKTETRSESTTARQEVTETTTTETQVVSDDNWDIVGPIRLRSADPEDTGVLELKTTFNWGTSSDGTDDDVEVVGEAEWGFAPNHELSFSMPAELGDGEIDGNADLHVGWQWRLWKEDECGWLPAFALRNILRVPSGYQSSGVDWTFMGLLTKSIVPDKFRFHMNPFLKSVNGDNLETRWAKEYGDDDDWTTLGFDDDELEQRHFRWGAIIGFDYRIHECVNLIADYVHESSPMRGYRNQHAAEFGVDWTISERQTLGLVTRVGLDGDRVGENFGVGITYAFSLDVPAICK